MSDIEGGIEAGSVTDVWYQGEVGDALPGENLLEPLVDGEAADDERAVRFLCGVAELQTALWIVPDPRKRRGTRHPLVSVLSIAILGCICGCDDAEALEDWARKESRWLAELVPLPHGTPSQDVFLRVFAALDPAPFRIAFQGWARSLFGQFTAPAQVAIDGQTHRGSGDRGTGTKPLHTVNAVACGAGMVLGQQPVDAKSNEIRAIPLLLQLLYIKGALVSLDAMGCQVEIARLILKRGGDYLLGLKGNQSELQQQTHEMFTAARETKRRPSAAAPPPVEHIEHTDGGHGRIEVRKAFVCHDFAAWVPTAARWPQIATLICIESTRTDTASNKSTTETRYYISSRRLDPAAANRAVRAHWEIENSLHHVLDVTFGQDANRTRTKNAATNLNLVRNFALNAVRAYDGDKKSMPRRRRMCDYELPYREAVLASIARS